VSIIARNWISCKAIGLALRQATRFVDDLGFRSMAQIRSLRTGGGTGRDFDLILGKSEIWLRLKVTLVGMALSI